MIYQFLKFKQYKLKYSGNIIQGRDNPQISFVPLVSVSSLLELIGSSKNSPYSTFWWKCFYVAQAGQ